MAAPPGNSDSSPGGGKLLLRRATFWEGSPRAHPLGVEGPRIKVQVKRPADKINADGLRSFMAVLGDQDVGIFISLGGFTPDAQTEARTQERRKLTLIDLEKLFDLWVEHLAKISDDDRRLLPVKPICFLAPSE